MANLANLHGTKKFTLQLNSFEVKNEGWINISVTLYNDGKRFKLNGADFTESEVKGFIKSLRALTRDTLNSYVGEFIEPTLEIGIKKLAHDKFSIVVKVEEYLSDLSKNRSSSLIFTTNNIKIISFADTLEEELHGLFLSPQHLKIYNKANRR